ncbi:MAG: hypothetical protein KGJ40_07995 [candidate division NC10 bacterium]|nr:hypothetical protein [candidate division NC10 bacterium]
MTLFSDTGFNEGRWAGNLAELLRNRNIVPGLSPKARVWRANWKQWIQFEEPGLPGPIFWLGKPGIISNEEILYAGYYVERGLPQRPGIPSTYAITPEWHWHGFIKCLVNHELRSVLSRLLLNLPEQRNCIWIHTETSDQHFKYVSEDTLLEAQSALPALSSDKWIDVVLGVFFTKQECLGLQAELVHHLVSPIIQAYEICSLVKDTVHRNRPSAMQ